MQPHPFVRSSNRSRSTCRRSPFVIHAPPIEGVRATSIWGVCAPFACPRFLSCSLQTHLLRISPAVVWDAYGLASSSRRLPCHESARLVTRLISSARPLARTCGSHPCWSSAACRDPFCSSHRRLRPSADRPIGVRLACLRRPRRRCASSACPGRLHHAGGCVLRPCDPHRALPVGPWLSSRIRPIASVHARAGFFLQSPVVDLHRLHQTPVAVVLDPVHKPAWCLSSCACACN